MIAVLEEDWGVSDSDCYPPRDKYGWREWDSLDVDAAEEQAKLDQENKEKRSWWDKFWGS